MKNKLGRRIGVFALAAISSICTIDMNSLAVSAANRTWQFDYVENAQEWTVPYSGDYKIESYGGKGADYADKKGGKGGKVTSTYTFQQGDVLKIYTGGNGNNPNGGWGNVAGAHTGNEGNDGGGATEIYVTRDGSTTRLMVAGGGGGANRDFDGGAGGAVIPGSGNSGGGGGGYNFGRNGNLVTNDDPFLVWNPPMNPDGTYVYWRWKNDPICGNQADPNDIRNYDVQQQREGGYSKALNGESSDEYNKLDGLSIDKTYHHGDRFQVFSGTFNTTGLTSIRYGASLDAGDMSLRYQNGNFVDIDSSFNPFDLEQTELVLVNQNGEVIDRTTAGDVMNNTVGTFYTMHWNSETLHDYVHLVLHINKSLILPEGTTRVGLYLNVKLNDRQYNGQDGKNTGYSIESFFGSRNGHPSSGGSNFIDAGFSAKDYSSEHGVNDGNGYVKIESLHTHHYTSQVTTNPTCEKDGIRTYTCTGSATDPGCGHQYTEIIPKLNHDCSVVVPLGTKGYEVPGRPGYFYTRKCSRCGSHYCREELGQFLQQTFVKYMDTNGNYPNDWKLVDSKLVIYNQYYSWEYADRQEFKRNSVYYKVTKANNNYVYIERKKYQQQVIVYYQNADGLGDADATFTPITEVSGDYFYGSQVTWKYTPRVEYNDTVTSSRRDGTVQTSLTYNVTDHKVTEFWAFRKLVTLDINGEYLWKASVDASDESGTKYKYPNLGYSATDSNNNMGTFDIYINGKLDTQKGHNVRDYYRTDILYGSKWEVENIESDAGKHYYGSDVN